MLDVQDQSFRVRAACSQYPSVDVGHCTTCAQYIVLEVTDLHDMLIPGSTRT